ncbi:MAG: RIP metalloprotease RseP [Candidatus Harrisonbacteria bacterium CG10_big_fil_rev_8_21_14_0_10_40_38]|uniref:Zinc metalloprotease n=1 Tax=Candidatus Harrisonbacteria bacterium CG10_big_fil_rev_8_21_14_0_10_40_38 TaxID=1974583 RepID=A0A2H0US41_9BACT|nr:MAG: RIP metalloprotease RseP [Candidatus Harrisonbacteria bacterium CG10_big_fil_rev_8_21_14_0_10_40_38]
MTILLFIIGLSGLIIVHEFGHFIAAKKSGLLVEEFGFGFPPRLFSKKIGETVYSFNLLPLGGFVRIHGEKKDEENPESLELQKRSFWFLPVWKRSLIVTAGVIMNFLVGWIIISSIFMVGIPEVVVVTNVVPNTPAESAGIKPGDHIVGFSTTQSFIDFVSSSAGNPVAFEVLRGSEKIEINTTPRLNPPEGEGSLGIMLAEGGIPKHSFFSAIGQGFTASLKLLGSIFAALFGLIAGIFTGTAGLDQFVGPVGIFQIASQSAQFGIVYLLQLVGLISLNLVALNILPLPALDGGRLVFLIFEKIKGSPLPQKFEIWANALGFILLLLLMIVITIKDVIRVL